MKFLLIRMLGAFAIGCVTGLLGLYIIDDKGINFINLAIVSIAVILYEMFIDTIEYKKPEEE